MTIAAVEGVGGEGRGESCEVSQRSLHGAAGIVPPCAGAAEVGVSLLDQPVTGPAPSVPRAAVPDALRSLSSATLAVGSAAAFLVLVTLLSFVPEGDREGIPGDRMAGPPIDRVTGQMDGVPDWPLRGALPPGEASPPPRERMARHAPS